MSSAGPLPEVLWWLLRSGHAVKDIFHSLTANPSQPVAAVLQQLNAPAEVLQHATDSLPGTAAGLVAAMLEQIKEQAQQLFAAASQQAAANRQAQGMASPGLPERQRLVEQQGLPAAKPNLLSKDEFPSLRGRKVE